MKDSVKSMAQSKVVMHITVWDVIAALIVGIGVIIAVEPVLCALIKR